MRIVNENEFRIRLEEVLSQSQINHVGAVTGPGRSGAIAAVYASHFLHIPFVPYGAKHPEHLGQLLIIDTARDSGATLRKAARRYNHAQPITVACFEEPPRVVFWYESSKRGS